MKEDDENVTKTRINKTKKKIKKEIRIRKKGMITRM